MVAVRVVQVQGERVAEGEEDPRGQGLDEALTGEDMMAAVREVQVPEEREAEEGGEGEGALAQLGEETPVKMVSELAIVQSSQLDQLHN